MYQNWWAIAKIRLTGNIYGIKKWIGKEERFEMMI